jgi:hypothetical protein
MENNKEYYRSAAIAGFHFDFARALLALQRAFQDGFNGNECVFMKTVLQGLAN